MNWISQVIRDTAVLLPTEINSVPGPFVERFNGFRPLNQGSFRRFYDSCQPIGVSAGSPKFSKTIERKRQIFMEKNALLPIIIVYPFVIKDFVQDGNSVTNLQSAQELWRPSIT